MSHYSTSEHDHDDANGPEDASRLDQSLRDKFSDFRLPPTPELWAGIEQRLPPGGAPRRRRRWPVPLPWLLPLCLMLGVGGGWLWRGTGRLAPSTALPATVIPANRVERAQPRAALRSGQPAKARPGEVVRQALAATSIGSEGQPATQANGHNRSVGTRMHRAASLRVWRETEQQRHSRALESSKTASELRAQIIHDTVRLAALPGAGARSMPASNGEVPGLTAPATAADSTPVVLRALVALERQAGTSARAARPVLGGGPSREAIVAALRAERAELVRLQHRADSLLLALGEKPGAPTATAPAADTTQPHQPLSHRWSLLLSATPEQNYFGLKAPAGDTLTDLRRNHETGRAGVSASLLAEYRLTDRLSVGAGLGYNRSGAELRLTNRRTDVGVTFDTTTTTATSFYTSTNTVFAIRMEQIPQLSPRFNGSGQVIGYDTVYVSRQDTVFTTIVQRDSVHTSSSTINPRITKKETVTYKDLRPDYHFLTLPMVFRYRLTPTQGRWWADVSGGVQLQFFLGGTQLVSEDGRTFRTETVGPRGGPFRPLNVGLSGSLALNYALSSRVSLSLAPGMRWQALSVYKPETGLGQNPIATGVQFGVRWKL